MAAITWGTRVNVGLAGSTLTKNAGDPSSDDAYAISTETLTGDGTATVTLPGAHNVILGFSTNGTPTAGTALSHSLWASTTGGVEIRELGVYKGESSHVPDDEITLERIANVIRYYKNATHIGGYVSPTQLPGTIYVHSRFFSAAAALTAGDITGAASEEIPTFAAAVPTTQTTAPATYEHAVTDRLPRLKPTAPPTPPALYGAYVDAEFSRNVRRWTDGTVGEAGSLGKGHTMFSSSHLSVWSRDSSQVLGRTIGGAIELFDVDATQHGKLTFVRNLNFTNEPTFSRVTAKKLYGAVGLKIKSHTTTSAASYPDLYDIAVEDSDYAGAGKTMGGTVQSSASSPERVVGFYGGTVQDTHNRCVVFNAADTDERLVLDTFERTIDDVPVEIDFPFLLHGISIDQGGNKVLLYPRQTDITAGAARTYCWNLVTGTIEGIRVAPDGHDALGYNYRINQDSSNSSPYDAFQQNGRSLDDLDNPTPLIVPPITPQMVYMGDHTFWDNARSDIFTPILSLPCRIYENIPENLEPDNGSNHINIVPYRCGDNEVVDFTVTADFYRWAHHRSNIYPDDGSSVNQGFWYVPFGHKSPDGRFIVYHSNLEKTLGLEAGVSSGPIQYRNDLFGIDCFEAQVEAEPDPPPSGTITNIIRGVITRSNRVHGRVTRSNVIHGRITKPRSAMNIEMYKGGAYVLEFDIDTDEDTTNWTSAAKWRNAAGSVVMTVNGSFPAPKRMRLIVASASTGALTAGPHRWDCWRTNTGAEEPLIKPSDSPILASVTNI